MSEARVACLTPGCTNTIQPATARRTGGYCGPCAGNRARTEREEYVRKNRRDVDLYAGLNDPVELLRIMHEPRRHDPLIKLLPPPQTMEQVYTSLTADDAARVITIAVELLRRGERNVAEDIARCLAAFTDHELTPLHDVLLEHGELWPPMAFRGASPRVRDLIVSALGVDMPRTNAGLQALAWIGDETVIRFLQRCRDEPPAWTRGLFIAPEDYARSAGWELLDGGRRNLYLDTCLAITPTSNEGAATIALRLAEDCTESCPWCGQSLSILMGLDLTDTRLTSFQLGGRALEVLTCASCTMYGTVYGVVDDTGHARWAPENEPPRHQNTSNVRSPWADVPLQLTSRRPIHASDWMLPTTLTQVGGLPAWVQAFDYPRCCRCHATMHFVAQIDNGQFPMYEGVYYAFLCPQCRVTATRYQQT